MAQDFANFQQPSPSNKGRFFLRMLLIFWILIIFGLIAYVGINKVISTVFPKPASTDVVYVFDNAIADEIYALNIKVENAFDKQRILYKLTNMGLRVRYIPPKQAIFVYLNSMQEYQDMLIKLKDLNFNVVS